MPRKLLWKRSEAVTVTVGIPAPPVAAAWYLPRWPRPGSGAQASAPAVARELQGLVTVRVATGLDQGLAQPQGRLRPTQAQSPPAGCGSHRHSDCQAASVQLSCLSSSTEALVPALVTPPGASAEGHEWSRLSELVTANLTRT